MVKLAGKAVADKIYSAVDNTVEQLRLQDIIPCLAIVMVGHDPASMLYVAAKEKATAQHGIKSLVVRLSADCSMSELLATIEALNNDDDVHGLLCQAPLPVHLSFTQVIKAIAPHKDVDGFHPLNVGCLAWGVPALLPCTPQGVLALLQHYEIPLAGKNVLIIGRSMIVGTPLSVLLSRSGVDATVTLAHSKSTNLAGLCARADVIISAVGQPEIIKAAWLASHTVVIDVGTNPIPDITKASGVRFVGDLDPAAHTVCAAYSPVPGGVGLLTVAFLLKNTCDAALRIYQ
jgi:methylenetetrahydrofolate dehydrogenase (NADP+)/methenyltetrahydrofolate cyclohydrolase